MVLGRNKGGSTSVKEATGMKDRFDFIVVGNDKKLFYKDTFGAAAAGANYITNAFPFLYLATVEEMMRRIDAREVGKVSEKMMSEKRKQLRPPTGNRMLQENRERYGRFSTFQRVCLEIKAGIGKPIETGSGFYESKDVGPVRVRVSPLAMRYGSTMFKKPMMGFAYILECFPAWYDEEIKRLGASFLKQTEEAFEGVALDSPMAAGSLLPVLLDKKKAEEMSAFTRACVEIYFAGKTFAWKETKARKGPGEKKLAKSIERNVPGNKTALFVKEYSGNYLVNAFGSRNRGMIFAIDSFPFLIQRTVADEIGGVFSMNELGYIRKAMAEVIQPSGATAGMVLIPAVEAYMSMQPLMNEQWHQLANKLGRLSVFARMCLEEGLYDVRGD